MTPMSAAVTEVQTASTGEAEVQGLPMGATGVQTASAGEAEVQTASTGETEVQTVSGGKTRARAVTSGGIGARGDLLGGSGTEDFPTVIQILQGADRYWPNDYSTEEKLRWLSTLDGQIYRELLLTHLPQPEAFVPYEGEGTLQRRLLVPEPFARALYLPWMESRICHFRGETEGYNNALRLFQGAYTDYFRWYHRNHSCVPTVRKFW